MTDNELRLQIPRTLDDPPRFLFWEFDVAIVFLACVFMGIMAGFFLSSILLGLAAGWAMGRLKAGQQRGYALHQLYWHLPLKTFRRTPPSCVRDFLG